jgi:raffinose/stachyose/melibiose transport system permease protein
MYAAFVLYPLLRGLWLSFHEWDGLTSPEWVGLANYRELLADPEIRSAFVHSAILILFYSVLPVSLGLFLAVTLSRIRVRGLSLFRTLLFLPQVIPMVVVAVSWRWIYAPRGPLNAGLEAIGADGLARPWLGDFGLALPAVGLVGTWVLYGLTMVLFVAGVQKIPRSLYDAARVDGAGPVREFFAVTLPGLRGELVVAVALTMIAALRNFDLVYMLTSGGPGTSTVVPALEVYRGAFQTGRVGVASAIGMALSLVIFALTFGLTRLGERE